MKDEHVSGLGQPFLLLLVAIGILMMILARDGGVLSLGGTAIALAIVMWPMVTHDPQRILAWWRKRPGVIARRKRRQAARLEKLNAQAAPLAKGILQVQECMDALPLGSGTEALRLLTEKYVGFHDFIRRFGLMNTFSISPLHQWLGEWVIVDGTWEHGVWSRLKTGLPGWDAHQALELALKTQHVGWIEERDKLLNKARKLQIEIDALSKELGVESQNHLELLAPRVRVVPVPDDPPPSTKRDRLAQLRDEADALEAEILAEEQDASSGPHRRAAGVARRD